MFNTLPLPWTEGLLLCGLIVVLAALVIAVVIKLVDSIYFDRYMRAKKLRNVRRKLNDDRFRR